MMQRFMKILICFFLIAVSVNSQQRETVYITGTVTNTSSFTDKEVIIPGKTELHVTATVKPLTNTIIKIQHEDAWVFFDNIRPQVVVDSVIPHMFVQGEQTVLKQNIRVAIYKHGTVVMPHGEDFQPLTAFTERYYAGDSRKFGLNTFHNDLKEFDNRIRSFKLKRGYMATLANNPDGTGYSRVYIADNSDLEITVLSSYLDQTISFIRVFNWEWVTKKGWDQTGWKSGGSEVTNADRMNATWFYTWSAGNGSTNNLEYVPIKQNQFWPGWGEISGKNRVTHLMSYNEPDHTEQSNVSVSTALAEWPEHMKTGLRLGSPATTDFNWLYEFIDGCKSRNYRVDYVVVHAYWPAMSVTQWYNALKAVYDRTGRTIWIKEWNNGANWTSESWPSAWNDQMTKQYNDIKGIVDMLDSSPFIERYSIYNWVEAKRAMILDDGWITPAGKYYADNKSAMAFNKSYEVVPTYSFSSTNSSKLSLTPASDGTSVTLNWTSGSQEFSSRVAVDKMNAEGVFEEIYNSNQTSVSNFTEPLNIGVAGKVQYRVRIILNNGSVITSNTQSFDITPGGDTQFGVLTYKSADWNTIAFKNKYSTIPVTIFGSPTNNNMGLLLTNRLKISSPKVLTYQLWPWAYQNVSTYDKDESVPYFILKPGLYDWGGLKAFASKTTVTSAWKTITFPNAFDSVPVVFVTLSSVTNDFPTTIRIKNVTKSGFDVKIQKESKTTNAIAAEIFSYLAVQQGAGYVDGKRIITGRTADNAVGNALTQFARISYGETIENPVFFAQLQTCNDDTVTANLRYRSVLTTEARVFKQRELSAGVTTSANEGAGWMVLSPVEIPQGVNQLKLPAVNIYPVPATDRIYPGNITQDNVNVEIYNWYGGLVKKVLLHGNYIDIQDLSPGMYFLKSEHFSGSKFIKK